MSNFAGQWPKQHVSEQGTGTGRPGFGLAGLVASAAVLAVLAGFGAIAYVAGSGPKGSGHVMASRAVAGIAGAASSASTDKVASALSLSADDERAPPPSPDEAAAGNPGTREALPPQMSGNGQETLTPAPVRTVKVAPDGRLHQQMDGLDADDPRWAQDLEQPVNKGEQALARLLLEARDDTQMPADNSLTAAIAPVVRKLATPSRPAPGDANRDEAAHDAAATSGATGYARQYVNMRAGPSNDADVLKVIPAKARLTIHGCKGWCEVSHDGQRGFVYKSFIRRG